MKGNTKIQIKVYRIVEKDPEDPRMMVDGGDYAFGVEFVVAEGKIIGGKHWTSADFDYCPGCGRFYGNFKEEVEEHKKCLFFDDAERLAELTRIDLPERHRKVKTYKNAMYRIRSGGSILDIYNATDHVVWIGRKLYNT